MSARSSHQYQVEGNVIYLRRERPALSSGGAGEDEGGVVDHAWMSRLDPGQRLGLQRLRTSMSNRWTPDRIGQKIRALGLTGEDLEHARRYVESNGYEAEVAMDIEIRRRMARGYGPRRIEAELLGRGFEAALVRSSLLRIGAGRWGEILESWLSAEPLSVDPAERKKTMDALLRRGFSPEQIQDYERSRLKP